MITHRAGKFVFCARKIFSPSNLRAWKNHPHTACPYEMTYFSNSARLIGRCAHGNLFAREDLQRALHTFQSGKGTLVLWPLFQKCNQSIITFGPYNAQTSPLLKHLKLRSNQDMIQQETVGTVYKAINNLAPEYLSVLFNRVSDMTGRTIRNANINLRPPRVNTTLANNCFAHRGALLWNNLPTEIKSAKSYESFKNRSKKQQHLSVDVNLA